MENLEILEKKVERRKDITSTIDENTVDNVDYLKLSTSIDAVYRLVNNTTRRIERSLLNIKNKEDVILKLLENSGLDTEEIKRLQEIEELENKLKQLKKGEV